MDKRFWSGAIIVMTIVVAGAGALPPLLLRPAPLDAAPVVDAAPAASKPVAAARIEPARPLPPAVAPSLPAVAQIAEPAQAVEPVVAPAPEQQPAAPHEAFPPVQPVGVAMQSGPDLAPSLSHAPPVGTRPNSDKSEKAARAPRLSLQDAKKRKGSVRPAIYPLREFLAWRR